jgi:signal recognition particle receptor subunit beta
MSFINYAAREINFKIVYYGPGLVGKTTSMEHVYKRAEPEHRGKMISLATETERTLFFDFRPRTLPESLGFRGRLHLYTVPGPVFYDVSRQLILKGVDGIIFVADSHPERAQADVESFENLESNLAVHGYDLDTIPLVLQYNKRDLPNVMSVDDMDALLNLAGRPRFESVARQGIGVFEPLKAIAGLVIDNARKQ